MSKNNDYRTEKIIYDKLDRIEGLLDKFYLKLIKLEEKINTIGKIVTDIEYEGWNKNYADKKRKYKEDKQRAEQELELLQHDEERIWEIRDKKIESFKD